MTKWVLICLVTSIWDGRFIDNKELAYFDSKSQCQEAVKDIKEQNTVGNFVCLPKGESK